MPSRMPVSEWTDRFLEGLLFADDLDVFGFDVVFLAEDGAFARDFGFGAVPPDFFLDDAKRGVLLFVVLFWFMTIIFFKEWLS